MPSYGLVYQCGIANVFKGDESDRSERHRLYQGDFRSCELIAYGMVLAGATVSVFHRDGAGDVAPFAWHRGPGSMFGEHKRPPQGAIDAEYQD